MRAGSGSAPRCGSFTYTLTIRNDGQLRATDVRVVQALPPHTTFLSASAPGGTVTQSGGTVTISYPSLEVGYCNRRDIAVTVAVTSGALVGGVLGSTSYATSSTSALEVVYDNFAGAVATVIAGSDTVVPTIACQQNIAVANTSASGAVVNYALPAASDNCSTPTVQCTPQPGSTFAVGTTPVTCTARDAANNQSPPCTFTVTVSLEQPGWKWCHKCEGLFYGPQQAVSRCPEDGGTHDGTYSWDYSLFHTQAQFSGQADWKWCHKCKGLFYGPQQPFSRCPATGTHDGTYSWSYYLPSQQTGSSVPFTTQEQWRWCHKCRGLFYGPHAALSFCPATGRHEVGGSWNYKLKANI
jgi:uncharacterized repeat protein (TIGR01451 family)